jgi:cobalt-zinc-cadmium efflux system outer membrane protein
LDDLCAEPPPLVSAPEGFRRPDIVAAEAALRKADADIRLQKANRIPDPTILAQYEHQPPDKVNTTGIGVSFPLPLWNRNRGNILAAEAAWEQARFALEKIQVQAAADMLTSELAYQDSIKKWRTYRDEIRPKSEGVRQALAYAYAKGGTSLLDMLVAERNDNDIRLAATQAAGDAAAALAALRAATTGISPGETNK